MTDIPTISFRVFIQKVKQFGFTPVRQKGSHIRFVHPDGRKTTIPDHGNKDVPYAFLLPISSKSFNPVKTNRVICEIRAKY